MSEDSIERYGGILAAPPRHRLRTALGVIGAIHVVVIAAFIIAHHHQHGIACRVLTQPAGSQEVWAIAFRPDSRELVALGADNKGYVWDAASGRLTASLAGAFAGSSGTAFAFSPDGAILATIDDSQDIVLRDATTGHLIATLPSTGAYTVAFSPDGRTLAVGNGDGDADLWDIKTRQLITTLHDPSGNFSGTATVAFGPDNRTLAVHDDSSAYLWDIPAQRLIATVADHGGIGRGASAVSSIAFSPTHPTLAVGMDTVLLWDATTKRVTASLAFPGDAANAMAYSPDGRILAAGTNHGSAAVWNAATGHQLATFVPPGDPGVTSMAFSPDSRTLAIGEDNSRIYLCPMR